MIPLAEIAEIESDEQATLNDIIRLQLICENLEMFIRDSGGEDRRCFKADLMRFQSILDQGRRLLVRIQEVKAARGGQPE